MKKTIASIMLLGTLTAFGQQPAKAPEKPAPPAAKAADSKPDTPVSPEEVKGLDDALAQFRLDQDDVSLAQKKVSQTDPVAKHALETLNKAVESDEDVKKAEAQRETDRKVLMEKIDALRKARGLGPDFDWDFNAKHFVQTPKAAPQASPAKG